MNLLFLIVALLFGPAAVGAQEPARQPVRSLLEMRSEGVVMQQWDLSCGAAALATVLTYALDHPISERAVAAGLLHYTDADRVRTRGGFSLLNMKRFAEARGFKAAGFHGLTLEQLLEFKSPIVPIDAYGAEAHFVVVMGRVDGDRIALADPAFGNHVISIPEFLAMWQDGLGFTVSRP